MSDTTENNEEVEDESYMIMAMEKVARRQRGWATPPEAADGKEEGVTRTEGEAAAVTEQPPTRVTSAEQDAEAGHRMKCHPSARPGFSPCTSRTNR